MDSSTPKPRAFQPRSPEEVRRLMEQARLQAHRHRFQQAVRTRRLSIIAVNCWGREIYRDLEIPYQTPFVNLYMQLPCFVGMVENFEAAMRAPLEFIEESRYLGKLSFPIGLLMGKYEIHFMHFKTREEAREKWYLRRERIAPDFDDCYFMLAHLGQPFVDDLRRFDQLTFLNKVLFVDRLMPEMPNAVCVPPAPGATVVDDALVLYRRCQHYFNLPGWLNKESKSLLLTPPAIPPA